MGAKVTTSDPAVSVDKEAVEKRVAALCKAQGITDDAGWSTFVAARFNATNASGLSAGTRTFMIEFFDKLVKIG